jgi:hypothetical protein
MSSIFESCVSTIYRPYNVIIPEARKLTVPLMRAKLGELVTVTFLRSSASGNYVPNMLIVVRKLLFPEMTESAPDICQDKGWMKKINVYGVFATLLQNRNSI